MAEIKFPNSEELFQKLKAALKTTNRQIEEGNDVVGNSALANRSAVYCDLVGEALAELYPSATVVVTVTP